LSQQRVLKALKNLGLSQTDAEVYIFLANRGPQNTENLAGALKLHEETLFHSLESLRVKGVVNSTNRHAALFYALPFDKALELLVKEHSKQAQVIEANKDEILCKWKKMAKGSTN